ncbi:MAG: ABC transporter ATP-binding protein [Acidimicrobiia bacterium]
MEAGLTDEKAPVAPPEANGEQTILDVKDLKVHFPIKEGVRRKTVGHVYAVDGISFHVNHAETLGLVGESGCGKSTTARAVIRLVEPTAGTVSFLDQDITTSSRKDLRSVRRDVQIVFQDPYASLNPRMTVREIVAEPLRIHGLYDDGGEDRVAELLRLVQLSPEHGNRFPHEFSGGQRQRIGVARALALNPQLLLLDEPVSALDVSIQAQVINLLMEIQEDLELSFLFIAHDLSVVRHISHRVGVMYLGHIVEMGTREEIFENPTHPYTQALLSAVPVPDPTGRDDKERIVLSGDVPNPADPPSGCVFRTRCWKAQDICAEEEPPLVEQFGHLSACHFATPLEIQPASSA